MNGQISAPIGTVPNKTSSTGVSIPPTLKEPTETHLEHGSLFGGIQPIFPLNSAQPYKDKMVPRSEKLLFGRWDC